MKSTFILLLAALLCSVTAIAQKTSSIPVAAKQAFEKTYPNAQKVKWDKEKDKYEASFRNNNQQMSVLYSQNGTVIETETSIAISALPAPAYRYAAAKGKVKEAARITASDGSVTYEAEVNGSDLIFDNAGNFIRKQKD